MAATNSNLAEAIGATRSTPCKASPPTDFLYSRASRRSRTSSTTTVRQLSLGKSRRLPARRRRLCPRDPRPRNRRVRPGHLQDQLSPDLEHGTSLGTALPLHRKAQRGQSLRSGSAIEGDSQCSGRTSLSRRSRRACGLDSNPEDGFRSPLRASLGPAAATPKRC